MSFVHHSVDAFRDDFRQGAESQPRLLGRPLFQARAVDIASAQGRHTWDSDAYPRLVAPLLRKAISSQETRRLADSSHAVE